MSDRRIKISFMNIFELLNKYGDFENGIPANDAIAYVVNNLDSIVFEKMFIEGASGS